MGRTSKRSQSHPTPDEPIDSSTRWAHARSRMKYFLPDSQDLVDPSFDFEREDRSRTRIRQRDDVYAHELFQDRVSDGILVSKGIVDGFGQGSGRYSMAQRHRLLRVGAPEFFRLPNANARPLALMGDCGRAGFSRPRTESHRARTRALSGEGGCSAGSRRQRRRESPDGTRHTSYRVATRACARPAGVRCPTAGKSDPVDPFHRIDGLALSGFLHAASPCPA